MREERKEYGAGRKILRLRCAKSWQCGFCCGKSPRWGKHGEEISGFCEKFGIFD